VEKAAQDNLAANDNAGQPLTPAQHLDTTVGAPVSTALRGGDATLTPFIRGQIVDMYKKGTATDVADAMQSILPAAAAAKAPTYAKTSTPGGVPYPEEDYANDQGVLIPPTPLASSASGAFARGAEQSVIPSTAGFAAFAPGAMAGAEAVAPAAVASGPFAPLVEGAGALVGGLLTSMGGSYATAAGQKKFLESNPQIADKLGLSNEQLIADAQQHPTASFAGELAPNLVFMRPGNLQAGKIALGGALGAGQEAGRELASDEKLDPEKIALSTIMTAISNKETALGSAISAKTGAGYNALRSVVGDAIKKAPETVTNNDIDQAIRMGFEGKGHPSAQDFKDTASVMQPPTESPSQLRSRLVDEKEALIAAGESVKDNNSLAGALQNAITQSDHPSKIEAVKWGAQNGRPDIVEHVLNEAQSDADSAAANAERGPGAAKDSPNYEGSRQMLDARAQEAAQQAKELANLAKLHGYEPPQKTAPAIDVLYDIYEKTGTPPAEVHEAAQSDQQVAESVANGEMPEKYQIAHHGTPPQPTTERAGGGETRGESSAASGGDSPITGGADAVGSARPSELSPEHQELENSLGVPETMGASQLGKLDNKISGIFANKEQKGLPKASELNDAQFSALEDYAKRIEQARENVKYQPIEKQIRNIITDESGSAQIPQTAKDFFNDVKRDVLNFTTPMETGSDRARASAKDFANKMRFAQWNGARIVNMLKERFSPDELKNMWEAMDASSMHAQNLESNGMGREEALAQTEKDNIGHFALPEEQKQIMKSLSDWAQHSWDQAKKLGMVSGEGLPFWTPRMAAAIGEDGAWHSPGSASERPSVGTGKNLSTTSGSLKQRKYLTAEDTEAAMKKAFGGDEGEGAMLVRDIRAMPLAITRLQQAISGRSLVNAIKEMSKETGAETISDSPKDGYFTLDHPALQTYKPRLKLNDDGKWEMQNDADGNPIFDKQPVYISKEFEGPLKAVLSQDSSKAYQALMALKGKSMGLIMYSPIIHNAVEWGRALPAMPGKVATFKIYFEGNRVKNDPAQMQEAINAGMVPIGSRFFNQDISSVIEQPNLTSGRSWTAKLLGGITGEVNAKAGEAVKAAIDKMGDIWHNTLLWDRVGDLQAGIYSNLRDQNIKNGMEPLAAQAAAAHIANRFAGALPMESMSNMARKMANLTMFSRSFTIGNLGVMKDMLKGLPSDVMAQLTRDVGAQGASAASKMVQRKAVAAFVMDIGLMYAGNSLLQDGLEKLRGDKTLGQIGQGYINRYHKLMQKYDESPWDLLNIPADLQALSSTSTNEPGKENRILFSTDPKTGTDTYMRMPTGKIGEEFLGWATSPLDMMRRKTSQLAGPLVDTFRNEDYFGHPIYDKDARGLPGAAENVGKVVLHFMKAQIPEDSIVSAYHAITDTSSNQSVDYLKAGGPLVGLTFSKGYPGGPEAGILAATSRRQEAEISAALPDVKKAIESDDEDKAMEIMDKLGMVPRQQRAIINHYRNPQGKVNARSLMKFERIATPEEKDLMNAQAGVPGE
jgi:hypothetical protein